MGKSLFTRYVNGEYEEVWQDMIDTGTFSSMSLDTQQDIIVVVYEAMQRIRKNLELLTSRLKALNFNFGDGFFDDFSEEEKETVSKDLPILSEVNPYTDAQIYEIEKTFGTLPLSLKAFYKIIGSVNIIGTNPGWGSIGPNGLDALFVYPLSISLTMMDSYSDRWKTEIPSIPIAPDHYYKRGLSGSGTYSIRLPNDNVDALVEGEWHQSHFVPYLRNTLKWGGFPGLEMADDHPLKDIEFLTKDFIPF